MFTPNASVDAEKGHHRFTIGLFRQMMLVMTLENGFLTHSDVSTLMLTLGVNRPLVSPVIQPVEFVACHAVVLMLNLHLLLFKLL